MLDGQQAGQGPGTSHADGWGMTGTPTGAQQDAQMADQDEPMRPPLSEHVIRPKLLTYEVQIDVRMCNGITADQDPVMRTDGDAGRNMGDGSGSRRHEGETVTDQRLRLMTDAWKQMPETYRSQVRDELRTGRCQDARHEEIFDDLCPPAIRIPTGVPEVRASEMVNVLWVVTGLRDDARREQLREGQTGTGPRFGPQSQSNDRDRAWETVSPTKAKSIDDERKVTDTVQKQRREALVREMPNELEESEKPPPVRSLAFNEGQAPTAPTDGTDAPMAPTGPLAQLTADMEECKRMIARFSQKQVSLENAGVRDSPSKLAAMQWPKINNAHNLLADSQRLIGLQTFETQVNASLLAAGVSVYRYPICMSSKAIGQLDTLMDKPTGDLRRRLHI